MSFNKKKFGSGALALALCASLAGFTGATTSAYAHDSDAPIADTLGADDAPATMNEGANDEGAKEDAPADEADKDEAPKAQPPTGGDNLLQAPDAEPMNEEGGGVVREEPARVDGERDADAEDAPKADAPESVDDTPDAKPETPALPDASDDE